MGHFGKATSKHSTIKNPVMINETSGKLTRFIIIGSIIFITIAIANALTTQDFGKLIIWLSIVLLPLAFVYWKQTLLLIPIWILVEGMIRKHIYDSVMVIFIKDFMLLVVYFRLSMNYVTKREPIFIKTPINSLLLIFLLWNVIELFNPELLNFMTGFVGIKVTFYYIPYFYLTRFLFKDKNALFKYLKMFLILSIPVAIMGYYQFIVGEDPNVSMLTSFVTEEGVTILRPSATFYYNSQYGQYVFMIFMIIIGVVNIKYFNKNKLLLFLIFTSNLISLFISGQRTAWVVLAAQISLFLILSAALPKKYSMLPKITLLSLISVAVIITFFPKSYESFSSRVDTTIQNPEGGGFIYTYKMEKNSLVNITNTHPFIGHGPGTSVPAIRHLAGEYKELVDYNSGVEGGYVGMWWELGIVGVTIFCLIIFVLLKYTINIRKTLIDEDLRQIALLGTLVCAGFAIANIPAGMLYGSSTCIIFFFIMGIVPALKEMDFKNEKNSNSTL